MLVPQSIVDLRKQEQHDREDVDAQKHGVSPTVLGFVVCTVDVVPNDTANLDEH